MKRLNSTGFAVIVLLCAVAAPGFAETQLGLDIEYEGEAEIDREETGSSGISNGVSITALINGYSVTTEFESSVSVNADSSSSDFGANSGANSGANIDIESATLTYYPTEEMRLRLGLFDYRPGFGEAYSPSSFFFDQSIDSGFADSTYLTSSTDAIAQTTLFASIGYVTLSARSWNRPQIPDTDSVWFPESNYPGPDGLSLRSISVDEADTIHPFAKTDLGIELGASLRWFDVSLLAYWGRVPGSDFSARVVYPDDDPTVFEVALEPSATRSGAFGLDVSVPLGPIRLWSDSALFVPRVFDSQRLSGTNEETSPVEVAAVETVSGIGIDLLRFGTILSAEYHGLFPVTDTIVPPYLASSAHASVQFFPFAGKLRITEHVTVSLADASAVFLTSIQLVPDEQLSMTITVPVAVGESSTELGQFADNLRLGWSVQAFF